MMNIKEKIKELTGYEVQKPKADFGDYAVFVKEDVETLTKKIKENIPSEIDHIEVKGPYINFFLSRNFLQGELARISEQGIALSTYLKGRKIMVEYTDANIMKPFHIGHVMSNAIGEAISRLFEASGAEVKRANYYGDVGLHVAKAIWGMQALKDEMPTEQASLSEKTSFLGKAYAHGAQHYEDDAEAKTEIDVINKLVYARSDETINELYIKGKAWSEAHVAEIHQRLGTHFDFQYPESMIVDDGVKYVHEGLQKGVFERSDGAIVFKGEPYGLHTRVFITSQNLPVYEAKDLGLNVRKSNDFAFDRSIIITGSEQNEYFKVVLRAMSLFLPQVAEKTIHIGHGLMKLATGKMSSRKGNIVTGEQFLDQVKEKTGSDEVAIGAIKYSILKQGIGHDIVFDFEKSLAVHGDSGVYLQYTHARLHSILEKAGTFSKGDFAKLELPAELAIIKHLIEFDDAVSEATERIAPNIVALYLYELANKANRFYEEVRILDDEDQERKQARLVLVQTTAVILKRGLGILGIAAPERI